ncbi:putative membrane protein YfcA [Bradyrhizobium sp. LM6.10]
MIDPLYVASGFGVGLLVGMTGVGGGSLMTPLLILLFGIHPSTAVGTDLLYAAATKTGGSVVHGWSRSVHWPAVLRLACGSLPASALTLLVLWELDLKSDSERSLVNLVLCFALLLTATSLIFRKAIMKRYRRRLEQVDDRTTAIATVSSPESCSVCWSRFHRSAPARSASPSCCCSIRACRWRPSSAPTSPMRYR